MSGVLVIPAPNVECSQCAARAVWYYRHECGQVMHTCDRHRLFVDAHNPAPNGRGYIECPRCSRPASQPINWTRIR